MGGDILQDVVNDGHITQGWSCVDYAGEWAVSKAACSTGRFHSGIDIGAPTGRPIRATRGGVVDAIGIVYLGPYAVGIATDDGLHMVYGHCSKALVNKGQRVKAGDVIALVGSLGQSSGPHVHFAVRTDKSTEHVDHDHPFNNILDPVPYLTIQEGEDMTPEQDARLTNVENMLKALFDANPAAGSQFLAETHETQHKIDQLTVSAGAKHTHETGPPK